LEVFSKDFSEVQIWPVALSKISLEVYYKALWEVHTHQPTQANLQDIKDLPLTMVVKLLNTKDPLHQATKANLLIPKAHPHLTIEASLLLDYQNSSSSNYGSPSSSKYQTSSGYPCGYCIGSLFQRYQNCDPRYYIRNSLYSFLYACYLFSSFPDQLYVYF